MKYMLMHDCNRLVLLAQQKCPLKTYSCMRRLRGAKEHEDGYYLMCDALDVCHRINLLEMAEFLRNQIKDDHVH